jgi:hypothetical protein
MVYSGAWGKLIHEKNQKQKSRDTVSLTTFMYLDCIMWPPVQKMKECRSCRISSVSSKKSATALFLIRALRKHGARNKGYIVSLKGLSHEMDLAFNDMYG